MSERVSAEERAEKFWNEIHKYGAGPYESKKWLRNEIRAAEQAEGERVRERAAKMVKAYGVNSIVDPRTICSRLAEKIRALDLED